MKKILFILLLGSSFLNAQNSFNTEQKDSIYLYSINSKLNKFEQTRNISELFDLHYMIGSFGRITNRKQNPVLWEQQINNDVIQAIQVWDRVANYPNFDYTLDYNRKYETLLYPNCYDEPKFIYYGNIRMRRTGKIDISNIKDESCRNKYAEYYRNMDLIDKEFQYQRAVRELHQRIILEVINLFDRNEFTSIDEINTFVLPNIMKYIDSTTKQEIFKKELSDLVHITKQKPKSRK
jgi:hypothetical protein